MHPYLGHPVYHYIRQIKIDFFMFERVTSKEMFFQFTIILQESFPFILFNLFN